MQKSTWVTYSRDRDAMYKEIIGRAIKNEKYDVAEPIIEKLIYSKDRDDAWKKLLDAKTGK